MDLLSGYFWCIWCFHGDFEAFWLNICGLFLVDFLRFWVTCFGSVDGLFLATLRVSIHYSGAWGRFLADAREWGFLGILVVRNRGRPITTRFGGARSGARNLPRQGARGAAVPDAPRIATLQNSS